ncbi:sigma-70 family RNA polymerase sigma factor [Amycolatopsis lurida]
MALLCALHDENAIPLRRYVRHLTGDEQLAQDVVQETLLRAWKNRHILEEEVAAARAWLYTVARNLVIDHRRSARARLEIGAECVPEGTRSDPTDSALDSWLVADALSELTRDHRAVLVRAYYLGHSVAELAASMEVPPGTVRSRLHYGLRALRLALQKRGVTGP